MPLLQELRPLASRSTRIKRIARSVTGSDEKIGLATAREV
jgi:hypothetical protein